MKFEHHVAYLYPHTLCETSISQKKTLKKKPTINTSPDTPFKHVNIPATTTPQKKTSRRKPTINTNPVMVPTAIPAMAPGDKPSKPGRAVVTGGNCVAVGEVKSER